MSHLKCKRWKE